MRPVSEDPRVIKQLQGRRGDLLLGLGVLNLMLGGIVLLSSAMTALSKPVNPEAPSE